MKEYRKLDDSIPMRYNRTTAQFRDLERTGTGKGSVQDQSCLHLWREIVGTQYQISHIGPSFDTVLDNWTRRGQILNYCVGVLDASKQEKQIRLASLGDDPRAQRKLQAELFSYETKVSLTSNFSRWFRYIELLC